MKLIKLSETSTRDYIYVSVDNVTGLRLSYNVTTYDGNTITATEVLTTGPTFLVKESLAEVVALLEDRDPNPAKVLFGKKDER